MNITSKLVGAGLALAGAISLSAINDTAQAGSITYPGELVGYTWAPLPQGLYFADTGTYTNFRGSSYNTEAVINVPVIIWSTPWTLFGGRIEAYAAEPSLVVGKPAGGTPSFFVRAAYNPFATVGLAWDLGHGFGFSSFIGAYAPINNALNQDFWTPQLREGLTWSGGDGYTLTGHLAYGIPRNNLNSTGTNAAAFPGSTFGKKISADFVNLDFAALKAFGKFSVGPVAFASFDVSGIDFIPGAFPYNKQSQVAVGGFVGYNFGPVIVQSYITHDVVQHGYTVNVGTPFATKIYETNFFLRMIVPLYTTPAPAPAVIAKY